MKQHYKTNRPWKETNQNQPHLDIELGEELQRQHLFESYHYIPKQNRTWFYKIVPGVPKARKRSHLLTFQRPKRLVKRFWAKIEPEEW
jgi:hypothetical protein